MKSLNGPLKWFPRNIGFLSTLGVTLDDEGFAQLKAQEQASEAQVAHFRAEHAKVAVLLHEEENKIRAKYGVGDDTSSPRPQPIPARPAN